MTRVNDSNASAFVHTVTDKFLTPLCERTKELVAPINLQPNDRLKIDIAGDNFDVFVVTPYAKFNGMETRCSYAAEKWITRIPERRESTRGVWNLKATDFTALVINSLWPADRIDWQSEIAEQVYKYLLLRFAQQSLASQAKARFKMEGILPEQPEGWIEHPTFPLSNYQKAALWSHLGDEAMALFMEQGTGKTAIAINRICHEAHEVFTREGRMFRAIVVCPKNVRSNWAAEVHRFATRPGKVTVLRGGKIDRIKTLIEALVPDDDECEYSIVIMGYETLVRTWDAIKALVPSWDLAICDESHYFKWHRLKRTVTLYELREQCDKRMILTGTPIANTVMDLYSQLEFLGRGLSGFTSFDAFRKFYGRWENRGGRDTLVGFENLPLLQERLARLAFMVTKEEAKLGLPAKVYDLYEVTMTKEQRELYSKVQEQIAAEIEDEFNSDLPAKIVVQNVLVRMLRLSQITSGFYKTSDQYDDEGNLIAKGEVIYFPVNPKLEALIEILKEKGPKEKTVVWSVNVPDIKAISERLEKEGIKFVTYYGETKDADRDAAVKAFNEDPTIKVFLGNQAAGSTGINLWGYNPEWVGTEKDHGCNVTQVIYYACNWNMVQRAQSEDRCHRRGTRETVRYTDLVVPGTIDDQIRARVLAKQMTALSIQDVRKIMEAILEAVPVDEE